jgi:adenosylhomocysteine nucleosidase
MNKIGIIGAMELEVETLKEKMTVTNIVRKASMDFYEGSLNGVGVVIVRSGVGKVNAGICVQILADLFQVTHIINTGVAGSLNPKIDIGDIVISTDTMYHDVDATVFGYQPGEIPQMGQREFTANAILVELTQTACAEVNPDIHVYSGRIVSGDQFVSDKSVKERLVNVFGGLCTEMEGAAIAQAATLNSIPFVIIRAISDKADESAEIDYPTFERKAAADCAKLVAHLITGLAGTTNN